MARGGRGRRTPVKRHRRRNVAPIPMRQGIPRYDYPAAVETDGYDSDVAFLKAIGACDDGEDEIWFTPTPAEAEALEAIFGPAEGRVVAVGSRTT